MAEYNDAAQASTIKIEDITSDKHNQTILQRLRDNDASLYELWIYNKECDDIGDDSSDYYVPDDVEELGWLGYYIGQNTNLNRLYFYENRYTNMYDSERPFFEGLRCNKSIKEIHLDGFDLSGGRLFSMMGPFFKSNDNLSEIKMNYCEFGAEGARQFSLELGGCNKSLKNFSFINNRMGNGHLVSIITALSMHPQLTELRFERMNIGRNECTALSTLLRNTTTKLQVLRFFGNDFSDEIIESLVNALTNVNTLQALYLQSNPLITIAGWRLVATLLELPYTKLETLNIYNNNIGNDGALVFANALTNNPTLKTLCVRFCGISAEGWAHFSKLLCDTSSVNNTYMSNHTLTYFGSTEREPGEVVNYLTLNSSEDKRQVAMSKVLQRHSHFDMQPFFEWEIKVLPIMIEWFTKASTCTSEFETKINRMRLSATYDIIREFPMLYIEPITRKEVAEYTAMEKQLQGKPMWQEKLGEIRECKARAMRRLGMK